MMIESIKSVEGPTVELFVTGSLGQIRAELSLPLLKNVTDLCISRNTQPSLANIDTQLFLRHELSELSQ